MRPSIIIAAFAWLSLGGCTLLECAVKPDDSGPEGDADTDADTDTDTDTEFCDEVLPDRPPGGPDCLSGSLSCGASVTATTEGGSDHFDAEHYENFFCLVPEGEYLGSERVYEIELAGDVLATFDLYSPCADLDVIVLRQDDIGSCPDSDQLLTECEADVSTGSGSTTVWTDRPSRYLVIVDGKRGVEDNFELQVGCESR